MSFILKSTNSLSPSPLASVEGGKKYSFNSKYLYRVLFCKDEFFKDEQEYRIILAKERIKTGEIYDVDLTEDIEIMYINSLFEQ